jgi:hypothetical protein
MTNWKKWMFWAYVIAFLAIAFTKVKENPIWLIAVALVASLGAAVYLLLIN